MTCFYALGSLKSNAKSAEPPHEVPNACVAYNQTAVPLPETLLAALIPLFPLDVVLFPGTPLPLHIFEPRYKEMIGECLAEQRTFGVVRALEQGLAEVGCTAEIVTVVKEYPDGRLDLVTEGRRRFELMSVNQERSFLQAEVLHDRGRTRKGRRKRRRPARFSCTLNCLPLAAPRRSSQPPTASALSFYRAGSLPLDLNFKQKLLALRSEPERLSLLISYFETIIPDLQRAARARQRAGGNGHAL